ncbi:glycosyltransferase family 2 protein [Synergistaceae bacterium OttesenSCG-928-I11]|nr:glycosyltransferase family 2 protein [Synergistaceae bacterium OttesenSCG-928-I11]
MEPKVTVYICTYNRADLLCEAISSVLAQTYRDFKIVVLNNASEDRTLEAIATFNDPRLSCITHEKNIGVLANWNFALDHATSEYFVILHDDDLMFPWMLEEEERFLETHKKVSFIGSMPLLSHGRIKIPDYNGEIEARIFKHKEYIKEVCFTGYNPLIVSSVLFRTKDIQESGVRFKCPLLPDVYFWFECNLIEDFQICIAKQPLFQYRVHPLSETSRIDPLNNGSVEGLLLTEKLLTEKGPEIDLSRIREFFAIFCLTHAMRQYCAGLIGKEVLVELREKVRTKYGWFLPEWRFEDKLAVTYLEDLVLSVKSGKKSIGDYLDAVAEAEKIDIRVPWKRAKIWFGDSFIAV